MLNVQWLTASPEEYVMSDITDISTQKIWSILEEVVDTEVPVLSIVDLGIVRSVITKEKLETGKPGTTEIIITPTYSGCPAMDVIRIQIRLTLLLHGYENIQVTTVLSPAWTTDWMSEAGKQKLKAYGIAPPNPSQQVCNTRLFAEEAIQCPLCNSYNTRRVSEFGSTACKSLHQCNDCHEPFDYFKCH